ncbi:MAG: NAD(P)H-hydrate dehydratase [bacterium]
MKILPAEKIREADAYTIRHEPIPDIDLMERAATECFYWCIAQIPHEKKIYVVCGTGNNGGDGFVIARLLLLKGYSVTAILAGSPDKLSPGCQTNYRRFSDLSGADLRILSEGREPFPEISDQDIIIDAIFGSGLTKPAGGHSADIIRWINRSNATIISIDLPSGLFCDRTSIQDSTPAIVEADNTLTFAPAKMALFFQENDIYLGEWKLLDIGIMEEFIQSVDVKNFYLEERDILMILKKRNKFAHKGTFGHSLLMCGSSGKIGAAVLASRAALRAGAGLVTARIPSCGVNILPTSVPEAMTSCDPADDMLSTIPDLSPYTSIGIGPGIGTNPKTAAVLKLLIQDSGIPLVFYADAINILSENKTWLGFLTPGSIFTPHPKEFERLAGKSTDQFDRNRIQREFSVRHQCYLILKGAFSSITTPSGQCYFNTTGNPGMATGGSGDVLTGIITGLKARGYDSLEASLLAVYIHGLAGDIALAREGSESLIAGDIITHLGTAFQSLYGKL